MASVGQRPAGVEAAVMVEWVPTYLIYY